MNKRELAEIKKNTKETNNCISRIAGCYVDTEKNKRACGMQSFYSLTEEAQFKYFELFQKGLSGKIGKNQINMEFPKEAYEEDGIQPFLYNVVKGGLKNDDDIQALFDRIIETYVYPDNYYIIIAYGDYDVPKTGSDGMSQDDSEEVYSFINCLICPMKQSKAGLAYNDKQDQIENAVRNMMVEMPVHGFLFPAFNDRSTDVNAILYYTKKAEDINGTFVSEMLKCVAPQTVNEQNDSFIKSVEAGTDTTSFDQAISICQNLHEVELVENENNDKVLDKAVAKQILKDFTDTEVESITKNLQNEAAGTDILLSNILNGGENVEVTIGRAKIKMPVEMADMLSVQEVDGTRCLVIRVYDDISVNGIVVKRP